MTFSEALKANETSAVQKGSWKCEVGELIKRTNAGNILGTDLVGIWQIVKDPIVFTRQVTYHERTDDISLYCEELRPFIGKNLKVTVEVIEGEVT